MHLPKYLLLLRDSLGRWIWWIWFGTLSR